MSLCLTHGIGHLSLARIANSKYVFGGLKEARENKIYRREEGRWKECRESAARMHALLPLCLNRIIHGEWYRSKRRATLRKDLSI